MESIINRYYDPTTDQFLSIDPNVATTDQPYVFTNDNPLNAEDPSGLQGGVNVGPRRVPPTKVNESQTIKDIVKALKSEPALRGLDLTGTALTSIATKISNDMFKNGGRVISNNMADALDGLAGFGKGMTASAGVTSSFLTISSDLAGGHSLLYGTADAVFQWSAGAVAGGSAALACAEGGPVAIGCGFIGFVVGALGANAAAQVYKYSFDGH